MPAEWPDWLCLAPPLGAIVLAIATRRVIASLFIGIVVGGALLAAGSPKLADSAGGSPLARATDGVTVFAVEVAETHLWGALTDGDHLRVFAFTLMMGAMVGVMHRSGGMISVVERLSRLARNRVGGQLLTWVLGLLIFFDDYANSLLLGTTMRPLCDRLKISREKLAYIVDSTAAPVAGLALVSTWVAGEIGYIGDGLKGLTFADQESGAAFSLFLASIPYRFYVLWALAFVPMVALLKRDFGAMAEAESAAISGAPPAGPLENDEIDVTEQQPGHWALAVTPIAVILAVILALLFATGQSNAIAAGESLPPVSAWSLSQWIDVFGAGDSYLALVYGSLCGMLSAWALTVVSRQATVRQTRRAAFDGAKAMLPALTILWMAWTLSRMTSSEDGMLNTGAYLGSLLEGAVSARFLPSLVFVVASGVAFSTGTSWGTMGILMPIVVRTTHQVLLGENETVATTDPILIATVGSVLAGAIFGDHCSPISDTTVLSSQASSCHHMAHVWTQLPYAFLVGAVSILVGTLPAGFGAPPWLLSVVAIPVMAGLLLFFGKRIESPVVISENS